MMLNDVENVEKCIIMRCDRMDGNLIIISNTKQRYIQNFQKLPRLLLVVSDPEQCRTKSDKVGQSRTKSDKVGAICGGGPKHT